MNNQYPAEGGRLRSTNCLYPRVLEAWKLLHQLMEGTCSSLFGFHLFYRERSGRTFGFASSGVATRVSCSSEDLHSFGHLICCVWTETVPVAGGELSSET